jgi:homoserine O-succinyltransferase
MTQASQLVLVESEEAGIHLATSADGLRLVFFQGHPEYDDFSLLKEYKREVNRFLAGEIDDYPHYPDHYFSKEALSLLEAYRESAIRSRQQGVSIDDFPEQTIPVENTWGDTGKMIFNNWLGTVYQLTGQDRRAPFMPGIDPQEPLAQLF